MTRTEQRHVPVLLTEALQYLAVRPGATVVDCTVGLGGHSEAIVRRLGAKGKLIGFDRDPGGAKAGPGTAGAGLPGAGKRSAGSWS